MNLQQLTIKKITETIGYLHMTTILEKTIKYCNPADASSLENLIIYMTSLRETTIDVEADSIMFFEAGKNVLNILEHHRANYNKDVIDVLIEIISGNLNYVKNIKQIS